MIRDTARQQLLLSPHMSRPSSDSRRCSLSPSRPRQTLSRQELDSRTQGRINQSRCLLMCLFALAVSAQETSHTQIITSPLNKYHQCFLNLLFGGRGKGYAVLFTKISFSTNTLNVSGSLFSMSILLSEERFPLPVSLSKNTFCCLTLPFSGTICFTHGIFSPESFCSFVYPSGQIGRCKNLQLTIPCFS